MGRGPARLGGQPSLRVSRAGLRVWGSLGVGESHKGVATWYRLCAGRVGGERHGRDRGEGHLWGPALCAQSEVSGQRRGVGANADHNICRLGRRKGLTFRKGKLLFLVISMPTTNRSGKP